MNRSGARCFVAIVAMLFAAGCGTSGKSASQHDSTTTTAVVASNYTAPATTTSSVGRPHGSTVTSTTMFVMPPLPTGRASTAAAVVRGSRAARRAPKARVSPSALGPATDVKWSTTPKAFILAPGGHATGNVWARDGSTVAGTVLSPGCPVLVGHPPVSLPPNFCPPVGHVSVIGPGHPAHWYWGWNATADGARSGTPLPPGSYTVMIGGASVPVTVT